MLICGSMIAQSWRAGQSMTKTEGVRVRSCGGAFYTKGFRQQLSVREVLQSSKALDLLAGRYKHQGQDEGSVECAAITFYYLGGYRSAGRHGGTWCVCG